MDFCSTQLLHCDFFSKDLFDHRRSGNEHLARSLDHDDEVSQCRRIRGYTDTRTHDSGDLGDGARGNAVLKEDFSYGRGYRKSLLYPGSHRVVETDEGDTQLACCLNNVGNLLCVGAANGPGQDRPVLSKEVNRPTINFAVPSYHPIGGKPFFPHAKVGDLSLSQHELLNETPRVEQSFNSLSRSELALIVLLLNSFGVSLEDSAFLFGQFFF